MTAIAIIELQNLSKIHKSQPDPTMLKPFKVQTLAGLWVLFMNQLEDMQLFLTTPLFYHVTFETDQSQMRISLHQQETKWNLVGEPFLTECLSSSIENSWVRISKKTLRGDRICI